MLQVSAKSSLADYSSGTLTIGSRIGLMIQNDLQLRVTQNQLERLRAARADAILQNPTNTILHKATLDGLKSLIDELQEQIEVYNET